MDYKNYSKNIFDDIVIKELCDNSLKTNCSCDESEREAEFVNSYEGKTVCNYVCKDCKNVPDQCKCYEEEYEERCDCGDCPECNIPRPHMIGLWGYNRAMVGKSFKK